MSESYRHMTLSERIEIERSLSVCSTVTEIAASIGFSRQSVVREIMRNRTDEGRATTRTNISQEALGGRTYADFLLLPDSVRANAAEMDCVIGAVGDECCLLTLFFRQWAFSPSSFCQGTQPGLWCGSCLI